MYGKVGFDRPPTEMIIKRKEPGSSSCFDTSNRQRNLQCRDSRYPHEAMVKCIMHNCGRGYEVMMIAFEKGIFWETHNMMMQE